MKQSRRLTLTIETKKAILFQQGYRCFYCGIPFGTLILYGGHEKVVSVQWEHFVPWSYSHNSESGNMVAACRICNAIKYNLIFESPEEARERIQSRRKKTVVITQLWDYLTRQQVIRRGLTWQGGNAIDR